MPTIGMCGTFDVENFGDLLFPLLAQHELNKRLPDCAVRCYSYTDKSAAEWPFDVHSVARFDETIGDIDGLLIGGGHLVRFDKALAPGYHPPLPGLHHPLSLWLTPALLAAQRGLPVAWNAIATLGEIPEWSRSIFTAALRASAYVAVRDSTSLDTLRAAVPGIETRIVPDSVFGIGALIDREQPSPALRELRTNAGLQRPYMVIQATAGMNDLACAVMASAPEGLQFLSLPIGPALGDADELLRTDVPLLTLAHWPHPLVIAELIAGAQAVVGSSLHLAIVATACGVPVLRARQTEDAKYAVLDEFDGVHTVGDIAAVDAAWLQQRLGARAPGARAVAAREAVVAHWDRVAAAFAAARAEIHPAMGQLWQAVPIELERMTRLLEIQQQRTAAAERSVVDQRHVIAALRASLSWRATRPLRAFARKLRPRSVTGTSTPDRARTVAPVPTQPVLRSAAVRCSKLAVHPYGWARIDRLFFLQDGALLSNTFPRDRFKIVRGYDGEKGYAYHARGLVAMSGEIVHPQGLSAHWQRLAHDLLSIEYRSAVSALTGIDLSALRIEANVFHYGTGAWLGAHVDLPDKVVTHVLYFNNVWDPANGGCLTVLRSGSMDDVEAIVAPVIGSSVVLVRSDHSWHAVQRVDAACIESRRSVAVTFYRDGAISTMWPPGDEALLADYDEGAVY